MPPKGQNPLLHPHPTSTVEQQTVAAEQHNAIVEQDTITTHKPSLTSPLTNISHTTTSFSYKQIPVEQNEQLLGLDKNE